MYLYIYIYMYYIYIYAQHMNKRLTAQIRQITIKFEELMPTYHRLRLCCSPGFFFVAAGPNQFAFCVLFGGGPADQILLDSLSTQHHSPGDPTRSRSVLLVFFDDRRPNRSVFLKVLVSNRSSSAEAVQTIGETGLTIFRFSD